MVLPELVEVYDQAPGLGLVRAFHKAVEVRNTAPEVADAGPHPGAAQALDELHHNPSVELVPNTAEALLTAAGRSDLRFEPTLGEMLGDTGKIVVAVLEPR